MNHITVTQVDWNNQGEDRTFHFHKTPDETPAFLERVERAYHLPSTVVRVNGERVLDA